CVGYLGFYDPHAARRAAAELQRQGLDTCIGAAAAFTIPGREDAPILSTCLLYTSVRRPAAARPGQPAQRPGRRGDAGLNCHWIPANAGNPET
ncbi:aminopeptidase, partial [Pseudomonas sp. ADP]|uniref:aminopeptidase n=1 Tax=Pseudomonas sp. (strain ADP) TaxID=47660 RepID=UPI002484DCF0